MSLSLYLIAIFQSWCEVFMIKPCIGGSESVLGEKCTDHLNFESYFYAITIMSDIQTLDNSFPA